MPDWSPQNIHTSMRVYTLDGYELGHIAKVYEDSLLVHKGYFFPTDRYRKSDLKAPVIHPGDEKSFLCWWGRRVGPKQSRSRRA